MALNGIGNVGRTLPGLDGISPSGVASPSAGGSFVDALGKAIGDVEQAQSTADASAQQVALGGGNLHETALALEKADISLRVAVKVRNKLVETYQDIMRMSV